MKTFFLNFLLLGLLFTIQSYGQNSSKKLNSKENEVSSVSNYEDEKSIQFLKEFYTIYILNWDNEDWDAFLSFRNKYLTKSLVKTLDELELDYDPIIQGQDCDKSWVNTLEITSEAGQKNVFNVCFFYAFENQKKCIKLSVVNNNGNYLINNILSDRNLHNSN